MERHTPLNRHTPLERGGELRRTAMNRSPWTRSAVYGNQRDPHRAGNSGLARQPADTGPSPQTVHLIGERDGWACVRCGGACHGERGWDWSVQHRRARQGIDLRPDRNQPQNLILLCGSATTGCHGLVESRRAYARDHGWAIRQTEDPLLKPVWSWQYGLIYLRDDGTWSSRPPTAEETP